MGVQRRLSRAQPDIISDLDARNEEGTVPERAAQPIQLSLFEPQFPGRLKHRARSKVGERVNSRGRDMNLQKTSTQGAGDRTSSRVAPVVSSEARPLVITVPEAAARLGLSRSAAYEAVRRKEIPSLKIGRRLLVPLVALERLLSGENIDQQKEDV